MKKLGLIGKTLTYSFSKKYFAEKFSSLNIEDWEYELYPLENIELLPRLLKDHPDLVGLNVTIPYKKEVLKYIHELDEEAIEIGAINTILIQGEKLIGANTDVYGFKNSLLPFIGTKIETLQALVLGTGGAAQAIHYVLDTLNIKSKSVSRQHEKGITYDKLDKKIVREHKLIVNCTPLGTHPNVDQAPPFPYHYLTRQHFLYDLVYNPPKTLFLQRGMDHGAKTINGVSMLELQAEASWDIWNKAY